MRPAGTTNLQISVLKGVLFAYHGARTRVHREDRIYVAGHRGLVGSAIWRELERRGFTQLIGRSRAELDLLEVAAVEQFYSAEKPQYVFVAAARVGGIL